MSVFSTRRCVGAETQGAFPPRMPSRRSGACGIVAIVVLLSSCAQGVTPAPTSIPAAVASPAPSVGAVSGTAAAAFASPAPPGVARSPVPAAVTPPPSVVAQPSPAPTSEAARPTSTIQAAPRLAGPPNPTSAPPTAAPIVAAAPLARATQPGAPVTLQVGTEAIILLAQPAAGQASTASPVRPVWTKRLAAGVLAMDVRIPAGQAQGPMDFVAQDGGDAAGTSVQVASAAVMARGLGSPDDITVGPDGTIVFSDFGNQGVNALIPGGRPVALATGIKEPEGVAVAPDGSIVVADQQRNAALRLDPATHRLSTIAAIRNQTGADGIDGLALDPDTGDVLFPDSPNGRLLRISPDGKSVTSLPGKYVRPTGVAKLSGGGYVVADEYGGRVYKIDAAGRVAAIGGAFATPDDVVLDAEGDVLVNSLGDGTIKAIAPDGRVTTLLTGLRNPHGLAVDGAGNLVVADSDRNRLLRLVRTFAIDPPAAQPTTLPATVPLTITRALGFSGAVTWQVVSTPPGVTAAIDADPATPDLALMHLSGTIGAHDRVLVEATSGLRRSIVQVALGPS